MILLHAASGLLECGRIPFEGGLLTVAEALEAPLKATGADVLEGGRILDAHDEASIA